MTTHTTTLRKVSDERSDDFAIDCATCGVVRHARGHSFALTEAHRHTDFFARKG